MLKSSRRRLITEPAALLEQLEARALLASDPLPSIADLTNPNNTVVRLETNFGDIDLEMFDQAAPGTVANFLKYVRDGDFDKTFFHRFSQNFVLQGGLARLKSPTTTGPLNGATEPQRAWESVPTDAPITNEFNQSNLRWTVAMARLGGQANSATSQFFINLNDNTNLNTVDGGFTVFARVANTRSQQVITSIVAGVTINISNGSPFNGTGQGTTTDGLPVRSGFTGTNVTEDQLVTIVDAEIIKPQGVAAFYTYKVVYPEGFAGSTINEFLPLGNPGSTTLRYQVIVRSEVRETRPTGNVDFWYRDKVVNTGTIAPNRRAGVTLSTFSTPANNLVPRQGTPYSIEVWATGPIAATISHYDFGSSTIEAFTRESSTTWFLPDIRKGTGINDFVVWSNSQDVPANLTLTFFQESGSTIEITRSTEAFRRGGLAISALTELVDGEYSLRITSNVAIVAASTGYKTTGNDRGGATQLGLTGNGASRGVLPIANSGAAASPVRDTVSIVNPNTAAAFVTLIARFEDATPDFTITPSALLIQPGTRSSFTLPDVSALQGKRYTVLYSAGAQRVFVSTRHIENNDIATNPFSYTAATRHDFAEGFMNAQRAGVDLFEQIAIYNPGQFFGITDTAATDVTVRFLFTDGFVVSLTRSIARDRTLFIDLANPADEFSIALRAQNANNRFFFSVEVVSTDPVVAQFRHYDLTLGNLQPSGGDSTIGTQRGTVTVL